MTLNVLRASLPIRLRHNFQTQWLNSFLFAPQSNSVLGDKTVLEDALTSAPKTPIGVALVGENSLSHHFVMPENASRIQWFDHWIRERRRWWKRHCYDSTMFQMSTKEGSSTILYKDSVPLETVAMDSGSQSITCSVKLDEAVESLLNDSKVEERDRRSLLLHYELAPFQASVGCSAPAMMTHAEKLMQILKKFDIRLLPLSSEVASGEERRHFADCDALGVCFNVLFTESTVQYGYVELRNRDTSVSEKVDANNCAITLATYLKSLRPVLEKQLAAPHGSLTVNKKKPIETAKMEVE